LSHGGLPPPSGACPSAAPSWAWSLITGRSGGALSAVTLPNMSCGARGASGIPESWRYPPSGPGGTARSPSHPTSVPSIPPACPSGPHEDRQPGGHPAAHGESKGRGSEPRTTLPLRALRGPQLAHSRPLDMMGERETAKADQDAFALRSHELPTTGTESCGLPAEIVSGHLCWEGRARNHIHRDSTLEALAILWPVFVTAANICSITDGASALLLMIAAEARFLGHVRELVHPRWPPVAATYWGPPSPRPGTWTTRA